MTDSMFHCAGLNMAIAFTIMPEASLDAGGPSGIIYGNDVGTEFAPIAYDAGYSHAVYYSAGSKKRKTTLGGFDEISTDNVNIGWE